MRKRGLANIKEAVDLLRKVHSRFPTDLDVKMELADALNGVMRIETNANSLMIQGTLDTPANKKLWSSLGEEALPLAKAAHLADPTSVRAGAFPRAALPASLRFLRRPTDCASSSTARCRCHLSTAATRAPPGTPPMAF